MKILLTGATGFIGSSLLLRLYQEGHDLALLSRDRKRASERLCLPCEIFECDLMEEVPPKAAFSGVDAVIHLAGESLAAGRWTTAQKQKIHDSRTVGTQNLVKGIQQAGVQAPKIFLSASAIGFYGDRGDEQLTETSSPGQGFLASVCQKWESEASAAANDRTRVVILRLGIVLGRGGGAFTQMLTPFSLGFGATLGSGKQWMSWVHRDDVVEAFCVALKTQDMEGPQNIVAPQPVTNTEFTHALAGILHKKAPLKAPGVILRSLLGEMSELLLGSARVFSTSFAAPRFRFNYSTLQKALDEILTEYPNRVFESFQFIPKPIQEVFSFFAEAKNLETITPPWLSFKIVSQTDETIQNGTEIEYRLKIHGIPISWVSRIVNWKPNQLFSDEQIKGPYAKWFHTHKFESLRGGTLMTDHVSYALPAGQIGSLIGGNFVAKDLASIFSLRREKIVQKFQ